MENNFERLKETLLGGKADRVPIFEMEIDPSVVEKMTGRKFVENEEKRVYLEKLVNFWQKAGYDYMAYFFAGYKFIKTELVETELPGHKIEWANERNGIIRNEKDLDEYSWPNPDDEDYAQLDILFKLLPEGMKLITGTNGVYEIAWQLMGMENFFLALNDNPEMIASLTEKIGEIKCRVWEKLLQHQAVGAMLLGEDMGHSTALLIPPDILRKYIFPWHRRMGELCRKYNKPMILHSDGKLYEILQDIIDCGFHALHPIEPKAMDIAEVRSITKGKLALLGHIELDTLCRGTPEEVKQLTREVLKKAGKDGGYAAGSSNTIPFYVNYDNFLIMNKTVMEYGKYPL